MGRKILKLFPLRGVQFFWNSFSYYSGAIFGIFHPKSRSEDTLRFTEYDFWKSSSRTN